MDTDFVLQVKSKLVWLNRVLRVYLNLYAKGKKKNYILVHFSPKRSILEACLVTYHPNHVKPILETQKGKLIHLLK